MSDSWSVVGKVFVRWEAPRVARQIDRFLASRPGPHLIHGFSAWGYTALLARERLRRLGIEATVVNSVYTTAEYESRIRAERAGAAGGRGKRMAAQFEYAMIRRFVAPCEGRIFTESRLVLLNYEAVHRLFLADYGVGAEVRRLPYASESAFLREAGRPAAPPAPITALEPRDAPLIVSVSRHDPRKGVDVLIRALGELRARGVRFRACLTSGGELLSEHRRLAERLGIADVTAITGWVKDPYEYLQHADIFVLPSLQEASGALSLLEALQAGLPVVASNIDGIPEDVTDGESALLIPPGDIAALGRALERLTGNAALRARLGRRGREIFDQRFSAESFATALGGVYSELGFHPVNRPAYEGPGGSSRGPTR
jgi:glycosyltransferase involved in cell wall biosynthesis